MHNKRRYSKEEAIQTMDTLGKAQIPFFFAIDFEMQKIIVEAISDIDNIHFDINGKKKIHRSCHPSTFSSFKYTPIDPSIYEKAFNNVQKEINFGNSFLLNLTFPSSIKTNLSLEDIYTMTDAKYKLLIPGECVVFSPESFVKINNGIISSFPMKGTIDASIPNASERLENNVKEKAEHSTIVDLIRNDLSKVASKVTLKRYRYQDKIDTHKNTLIQLSSEISGTLPFDYPSKIGSILFDLLPAGSISGAPKKKTLEIIQKNEIDQRGYYTGVFGIFDGTNLDSGVMIRYIEEKHGNLYFRSGGGITSHSDVKLEYQELIDKIYVPLNRKYKSSQRPHLQTQIARGQA